MGRIPTIVDRSMWSDTNRHGSPHAAGRFGEARAIAGTGASRNRRIVVRLAPV